MTEDINKKHEGIKNKKKRNASEESRGLTKQNKPSDPPKSVNIGPSLIDIERKEYMHKIINLIKVCNKSESKERLPLNSDKKINDITAANIHCSCSLGSIPGFDLRKILIDLQISLF